MKFGMSLSENAEMLISYILDNIEATEDKTWKLERENI